MINDIIRFINNEQKGILTTIGSLLFIIIIMFVYGLISGAFCNIEQTLNLTNQYACDSGKTFYNIIKSLINLFLFISSIESIYGLYHLYKKILNYFKYGGNNYL